MLQLALTQMPTLKNKYGSILPKCLVLIIIPFLDGIIKASPVPESVEVAAEPSNERESCPETPPLLDEPVEAIKAEETVPATVPEVIPQETIESPTPIPEEKKPTLVKQVSVEEKSQATDVEMTEVVKLEEKIEQKAEERPKPQPMNGDVTKVKSFISFSIVSPIQFNCPKKLTYAHGVTRDTTTPRSHRKHAWHSTIMSILYLPLICYNIF